MTVRVTVAAGRVVRDQRGRKCPDAEFDVNEKDFFWAGLIRCGDLEVVQDKKQDEPARLPAPGVAADKRADSK